MVAAASKGIGRGVAAALLGDGCRVSICARTAERLESARAAVVEIPYLTEGAHLLSLRRGASENIGIRTVHVWRPPPESGRIFATSFIAVGMTCGRDTARANLAIDGRRWKAATWLHRESEEGCRGIACFDLNGLPPGPHRLSVEPRRQPISHYEIVKLPMMPLRGAARNMALRRPRREKTMLS